METIKEKTFSITEEHCREMISGVCKQCGGELKPMETVDNSDNPTYWAACTSCEIYCWGVSKEVYEISKSLVDNHGHVCYTYMDSPLNKDDGYKKYWRLSQIGGTCYIVQQVLGIKEKLNKEQNVQGSVARNGDAHTKAGNQKKMI